MSVLPLPGPPCTVSIPNSRFANEVAADAICRLPSPRLIMSCNDNLYASSGSPLDVDNRFCNSIACRTLCHPSGQRKATSLPSSRRRSNHFASSTVPHEGHCSDPGVPSAPALLLSFDFEIAFDLLGALFASCITRCPTSVSFSIAVSPVCIQHASDILRVVFVDQPRIQHASPTFKIRHPLGDCLPRCFMRGQEHHISVGNNCRMIHERGRGGRGSAPLCLCYSLCYRLYEGQAFSARVP